MTQRRIDLFYHGYELHALDRPFGRLQSELRLKARTIYRGMRRRQLYTGFYTAFQNLRKGLVSLGMDVHVNDFAHARRNPDQPVGISGYPGVYDRVRLPNPAIFGPGFVPPPHEVEAIGARCNIRFFTAPSEWACKIWRPTLGDRVQPLFAPIILSDWPDLSQNAKTNDVLIYDKIRWQREALVPRIHGRLGAHLKRRGLTSQTLRYGAHHGSDFRAALRRSRAMVFLCEHETQGLAYQEAMASGIPILAWDEGRLIDPAERRMAPADLVVSSVPYFDARCGMTFTEPQIEERFDAFWSVLEDFRPRDYVAEELNAQKSAQVYLNLLDRAAR
ncbi:glycosyltransferase [Falsirhodobacter sp. 1013]|uniref:glycosyltransferase n=1 Tax=Falsirhodobacter sp. 1013 TaxID=3417566 RepID=UPI003EB8AE65